MVQEQLRKPIFVDYIQWNKLNGEKNRYDFQHLYSAVSATFISKIIFCPKIPNSQVILALPSQWAVWFDVTLIVLDFFWTVGFSRHYSWVNTVEVLQNGEVWKLGNKIFSFRPYSFWKFWILRTIWLCFFFFWNLQTI